MLDHIVVGAIATNCWIVRDADFCAVIDPGADASVIIARLRRHKLVPTHILLTHGHFDHLAALPDLVAAFGSEAPLTAVHASDAAYLGAAALEAHRRDFASVGAAAYVMGLWKSMPAPARLLAEGDRVGPFTVLHLPGHSPGSVAFHDQAAGRLFSGDTLFRGGVGRTDLPGGDVRALDASLRRLLALEGRTEVYPGHGEETRIERERA